MLIDELRDADKSIIRLMDCLLQSYYLTKASRREINKITELDGSLSMDRVIMEHVIEKVL